MIITTEITPPDIKHGYDFLDQIAFIVCRVAEMDQGILKTPLKARKYSDVRNLYFHFACLYTDVSQTEIGKTANRVGMTVSEASESITKRFCRGDRKIYSLYLNIKHEIDLAVECLYPATHYERIAFIHKVSKTNLCL